MLTLPKKHSTLIAAFAPVFTQRLWSHIQVLVVGSILAPGSAHRDCGAAGHGLE